MSHSEIAQLKQQIVAEYEAGRRALTGLTEGTAQHQFITKKMENMHKCQQRLIELVGPKQASQIISEAGL